MNCFNCNKGSQNNGEDGDLLCSNCNTWVCTSCSLDNTIQKENCTECKLSYCQDKCKHYLVETFGLIPYGGKSDKHHYYPKICVKHFRKCVECGNNKGLKNSYECFSCHKLYKSICTECLYKKDWKTYNTCWTDESLYSGNCMEFSGGNIYIRNGNISMLCPDCKKVDYTCEYCLTKKYCDGCKNTCTTCRKNICQDCYEECEVCEKIFCNSCSFDINDRITCIKHVKLGSKSMNNLMEKYSVLLLENTKITSMHQELESKYKALEEENHRLKLELDFMPGGPGYELAHAEFEQLRKIE